MAEHNSSCPGSCDRCSGIHITVPPDPGDARHLLWTHMRFSGVASVSSRSEEPGSIYVRGSREYLAARRTEIEETAGEMGLKMHACLDGAAGKEE